MKDKIWVPQNFKAGSEDSIVGLMQDDINNRSSQAVFNRELWYWKYKDNNSGYFENWIKLAKSKDNDFIGGHYTAIPLFLIANGKRTFSAQSVDTITHVNFRKQGVFTELAELCYKELEKDDVSIIIGYPNDNSYPGFVSKLQWKKIFEVFELGYILDISKLVNYKYKNFFINCIAKTALFSYKIFKQSGRILSENKDIKIETIELEKVDSGVIEANFKEYYGYFVDRSKEYLKWRYQDNPVDTDYIVRQITLKNQIIGYYILKIKNYPHRENIKIAHLMELLINPDHDYIYKTVLSDVVKISKNLNCTLIYTYSHKFQHDYKTYKAFGFLKLDVKNFIIRILKNEENFPGIYEAKNWFISQGDSDRA